eukprot:TRINITY_DN3860_c0_g1_i1.p1 TRINITY_DN3860_c0_g1~~TRINITY_DN3860_c0_g1_i1.p1  ORF type:complete len:191 (+),score=31.78 TRINITY_DN3860_c0_g1_i1:221-793(+)
MKTTHRKEILVRPMAVGAGGVGKTCLSMRYGTGMFPTDYVPTTFDRWNAALNRGDMTIQIAPSEALHGKTDDVVRFRPILYQTATVFLLCFAVNDRESLDDAVGFYYPEIRDDYPCPVVLVGLKTDLRGKEEGCISEQEGRNVAKKLGCATYVECSALNGDGVQEVFDAAVDHSVLFKQREEPYGRCQIL